MKTETCYLKVCFVIATVLVIGCSKNGSKPPDVPPLSGLFTFNAQSITATNAYVDGNLSGGNNASTLKAWGFCWSTHTSPTVADNKVAVPLTQNLYATITGLQETTTYYVRAFATNPAGTIYGNEISFTTLTLKPIVQINDIFDLSSDFAIIDCKIVSEGNTPVLKAGVCWSTNPNPTIADDTA